ncbi:MAG: twin-arginine translocation signal domain-containing protein [Armatimonadia bacterium]|nr:twin-arginine translocation signal domain-containing protein [Armatimonadia bacterium]
MSEDRREEQTPEAGEEQTDRRDFLKKTGMAAAALAGLAATANAADIRPNLRTQPTLRVPTDQRFQVGMLNPNTTERFVEVFDGRNPSEGLKAEDLAKLDPAGKTAGLIIFDMSGKQQELKDVGQHIAVLFTMLASGMQKVKDVGDLRAAGNGCGNNCGYGCAAPMAGGFICGNDCSPGEAFTSQLGMRAGGFICGNNCASMGMENLQIDPQGEVLEDVNFAKLNMTQVAGAMRNAAQAYGQVFG